MNLFVKCSPTQMQNFLNIHPDQVSANPGEENDLFIGENRTCTLSLPPNSSFRFRDIVVLGELIIQCKTECSEDDRPKIFARDIFAPRLFTARRVNLDSRSFIQHKNLESFFTELRALYLEWQEGERRTARRMALVSVLVPARPTRIW